MGVQRREEGRDVTKQESVEGLCRVETEQQVWGLLRTVSRPGVWDLSKFLRLTGPPQGLLMTSRLCQSCLSAQEILPHPHMDSEHPGSYPSNGGRCATLPPLPVPLSLVTQTALQLTVELKMTLNF